MRKSKDEVKYYRICGIIELVLSIALTGLFIFLIATNDASRASGSLYASLVFVFVFGSLTFATAWGFILCKPSDDKNANIERENVNTNLEESTTKN